MRAVASADTKCCRIPWAHAYLSVCRSPAGSHATVFGPFSMPLLSTHQTPRSTSSTKEKRGEFLPFATACCLLLLLLLRLSRSAFPPSILRDATAPVQMQHAMHVAGPRAPLLRHRPRFSSLNQMHLASSPVQFFAHARFAERCMRSRTRTGHGDIIIGRRRRARYTNTTYGQVHRPTAHTANHLIKVHLIFPFKNHR